MKTERTTSQESPIVHQDGYATVYHGDCLVTMRGMPDNSVDAIVTDPPYGLTKIDEAKTRKALAAWLNGDDAFVPDGKGFMNKRWDQFVPPPAVWREAMRVLRPGGYMLCFAGSRTIDLMTLSVRLGGFEIRDTIEWIYGCLTDDAEVLTSSGWKRGVDVEVGESVAQWDHETGLISLAEVEDKYLAPWNGDMRVLRNSDTDQVLTPNHRVYHQRWSRKQVDGVRRGTWDKDWSVTEAGEVSTYERTRLPVSGLHDGPGIGGEDYAALLGWIWTEGGFDKPASTGVRIYQSSVNQHKVDEISALLNRVAPHHKLYKRERDYTRRNGEAHQYTENTWFFTGEIAARVREDLPNKHPDYALLWRMTLAEKRAFYRSAMLGDGSGLGSGGQQFYQKDAADIEWFQALLHTIGLSGKKTMREDRDCGAVYVRERSTTELQSRHLKDSVEHYEGNVWCVKVPTGAFVARRNGHVFITGNSGFPKSMNIAKEIDKKSGFKGDVVGTEKVDIGMQGGQMHTGRPKNVIEREVRELSPEAKKWDGWGTALKPAHEPIIVAQKPLDGTVVGNVEQHGVGGLNIGASRIAVADGDEPSAGHRTATFGTQETISGGDGSGAYEYEGLGRFPSNVLLQHLPWCEEQDPGVTADTCQDDCPVKEMDAQSGKRAAGNHPANRQGFGDVYTGGSERAGTSGERRPTDSGGASRYFPTFRYQAKAKKDERPTYMDEDGNTVAHSTVKPTALMEWLVRLVTPRDGVVMDPFLGSGTTCEAATLGGFHSLGIELDDEHVPLIKERLTGKDIWAGGLLDDIE